VRDGVEEMKMKPLPLMSAATSNIALTLMMRRRDFDEAAAMIERRAWLLFEFRYF